MNAAAVVTGKFCEHVSQRDAFEYNLPLPPRQGVDQFVHREFLLHKSAWTGDEMVARFQYYRRGGLPGQFPGTGFDGTLKHGDFEYAGIFGASRRISCR